MFQKLRFDNDYFAITAKTCKFAKKMGEESLRRQTNPETSQKMKNPLIILLLALFTNLCAIHAEDGSQLWLRYDNIGKALVRSDVSSPTAKIAVRELQQYCSLKKIGLHLDTNLGKADAFRIAIDDEAVDIWGGSDRGLLYGAYELLRQQATHQFHNVTSVPQFELRLLNHWDNLDGSIERGYAGKSIWRWEEINAEANKMSAWMCDHVREYCRANASLGINGSVLNNVNASPKMLSAEYLGKVKMLADAFRPYGIRVYLSINFATPMALKYTATADPLDDSVRQWWVEKANEIYALIPDFGGFLVKANSEGQPGPGDYHRTHADGANMLADALKPHGGIVMWRSFVYGANHKGEDRVKQAVSEFKPMDGLFRDNVILQSKNGPLDFQPREPYAPIFDNIKQTPQMAELQITQEYLGQSRHLVYLAPMWKEFFGFVSPQKLRGIAGVANIGDDANWCGHHFSQANWYAFGRLAWDPSLASDAIAREWLVQTFGDNTRLTETMTAVMEESREDCVDYMMPLGLHHIFTFDHHYGPGPSEFKAEYPLEWCPVYYHKADKAGIGFDRTHNGSNAVSQYRAPFDKQYDSLDTCPEEYLLWFHHVAWDYRMKNGKTLWKNLVAHYGRGVKSVEKMRKTWKKMRPYVDAQRWNEVDERLEHQVANAKEWRDTCLKYFGSFTKK